MKGQSGFAHCSKTITHHADSRHVHSEPYSMLRAVVSGLKVKYCKWFLGNRTLLSIKYYWSTNKICFLKYNKQLKNNRNKTLAFKVVPVDVDPSNICVFRGTVWLKFRGISGHRGGLLGIPKSGWGCNGTKSWAFIWTVVKMSNHDKTALD